jgi:aminobenzoyl-glutamate utilization protein B
MFCLPLAYCLCVLVAPDTVSADDQGKTPVLSEAQQTAVADVEKRSEELKLVNKRIWEYAEVGLQEYQSSGLLIEKLKANGFDVQEGVSGMPTAFVASYGSGSPIIGILAEYDALPDLSQQATPFREPLQVGAGGHGCGHSGLGTGALGAVLAVKAAMDAHQLKGTIRLYGTPAEETLIGKVYMLLDGQFQDLDACLHWHPSSKNSAQANSSKAMVSIKFSFKGVAAHGAGSPHLGRSALDAVELMNIGVNFMREHVKEDARTHYVITNGGGQPNVVPPEASVWYFVRANDHHDVEHNVAWIKEIAAGAAQMTRTTMSYQIDTDCHEVIPNTPLVEVIDSCLKAVGPVKFTAEEHAFAQRLQQTLTEQFQQTFKNTLSEVISPPDTVLTRGSTDVGDISWHVPTGGLRAACFVEDSPGHSWQNVACIGSSIGEKGTLGAAAVQLFQNPELLTAARADFKKRMEGRTYTTMIPEGQKAPKAIR